MAIENAACEGIAEVRGEVVAWRVEIPSGSQKECAAIWSRLRAANILSPFCTQAIRCLFYYTMLAVGRDRGHRWVVADGTLHADSTMPEYPYTMGETVLRDFFRGRVPPAVLAQDVRNSVRQVTHIESAVEIEDMQDRFLVTRQMLVSLCDAALSGELPRADLLVVGFALITSGAFEWDDDVMGEDIDDWACPELNYALTQENVQRFKNWLLEVEPCPTRPTRREPTGPERLVSVRRKISPGERT